MYKLLYFFKYYKIPVTTMNHTDDFFILMVIRKTPMFVSSRE